jgi:hypothetical protein
MTAGTEPLTERPAWKALKAHYTLGPPSESSLPMLAPRTINRWNAPPKVRFAPDSPVEEAGFEPSVPHTKSHAFPGREAGLRSA